MLPSSCSGLGPDEVGQKRQNYSTYDVTHKTSKTENQKTNFFIGDSSMCQVFRELGRLSSAIGVRDMDLQRHVETVVLD